MVWLGGGSNLASRVIGETSTITRPLIALTSKKIDRSKKTLQLWSLFQVLIRFTRKCIVNVLLDSAEA